LISAVDLPAVETAMDYADAGAAARRAATAAKVIARNIRFSVRIEVAANPLTAFLFDVGRTDVPCVAPETESPPLGLQVLIAGALGGRHLAPYSGAFGS
jgi:hypothetical protein